MTIRTTAEALLGLSAAIATSQLADGWLPDRFLQIGGVLVSVASTMLGFVMAALAILISVSDKTLIKTLKETGHLQDLLKDLFWTAAFFGGATLLATTAVFVPIAWGNYLVCAAFGATVTAALRLGRAGGHFFTVVSHL